MFKKIVIVVGVIAGAAGARSEHSRMKQLLQQKMISAKDYETADNARQEAEVRLSLAHDGLALLEKGKFSVADNVIDTGPPRHLEPDHGADGDHSGRGGFSRGAFPGPQGVGGEPGRGPQV